MNKKLLLSLGLIGAINFTGCSIVSSMMTTEAEYLDKASAALDIPASDLTVLPESIQPSLQGLYFQVKGKDGTLYKCNMKSGLTGTTSSAACQKKVGNKWEKIGNQEQLNDDGSDPEEGSGAWFNFSIGGGDASDRYGNDDPKLKEQKEKDARNARRSRRGTQLRSNAQPVVGTEVIGATASDGSKPTIVFYEESENVSYRTNPTKTYNGRFKVRDEQGHSYECHFANVGQVVSDTVSVCTKLY